MQIAEVLWNAERGAFLVIVGQNDAKVVISNIRREVVPNNAFDAFICLPIDDIRFQNFNQWESIPIAFRIDIDFDRNDFKFHRITIAFGLSQCAKALNRLSTILRALRRFSWRFSPRAKLAKLVVIRVVSEG